jgi:peptide/nickel transport system substrate-binding protein
LKKSRVGALVAVATSAALILAGCSGTTGGGSTGGDTIAKGTAVTVAQNASFSSYNSGSANGNSTYNSNITYMTGTGLAFNYYDSTPKLLKNTKFGTYEKVSDDPLTIKYTVNKGVKWSDGVQVGAADLLLAWADGTTKYNDPKGVNFASASAGTTDLITETPKISDDGRTLTVVYSKPYVDWELNLPVQPIAAHAAYTAAFPDVTGQKANDAFVKAIQDDDTATLTKVAAAWSTKFDWTDLPSDKNLYLSFGPYIVSAAKKDQYITLSANKDYNWGPMPHLEKITFRFIQDPTAQVQALQNGEIQVIYGQATADTVTALKALKDVTTSTDSAATYEHVDPTFNNGGPFDPKTYGGDASKAQKVREAFLLTIPRDQIITNLIKPIQPDAKPMNSLVILPGAAGYDESVAQNGSDVYAQTDVAKAKQLLAEAGVKTPVDVRFMYGKSNTRRAAEFALIQASAKQAGFNVIDKGNDDWPSLLGNGSYDAILFAWAFPSLAVLGAQSQLITGGGNNFNGYSSKVVDDGYNTLQSEFDQTKQHQDLAAIDKQLWTDAYSLPIFQFPDVTANAAKITGVKYSPLVPNVFWNFFDWQLKK